LLKPNTSLLTDRRQACIYQQSPCVGCLSRMKQHAFIAGVICVTCWWCCFSCACACACACFCRLWCFVLWCAVVWRQVRRMHFHDFMLDVHKRLRSTSGEADPLKHIADDVASGIKVRKGGGGGRPPWDRWHNQGKHNGRQLLLHTVT